MHSWFEMREEAQIHWPVVVAEAMSLIEQRSFLLQRDSVTGRTPIMTLWEDLCATDMEWCSFLESVTIKALSHGLDINDVDNRGHSLLDICLLSTPSYDSHPTLHVLAGLRPQLFLISHGAKVEARHVRLMPELALYVDCSAVLGADPTLVAQSSPSFLADLRSKYPHLTFPVNASPVLLPHLALKNELKQGELCNVLHTTAE
jgi:hypothetical protein